MRTIILNRLIITDNLFEVVKMFKKMQLLELMHTRKKV